MIGDDPGSVRETDDCGRCGVSIQSDGENEYRHRLLLEDYARSSGSRIAEKLCGTCWHHIQQAVIGESGWVFEAGDKHPVPADSGGEKP